jgi:hypothetical protein
MNKKSKAIIGLSNLTPDAKVTKAQNIVDTMQASGNFPNAKLPMPYAALQLLITNLHNSILVAGNGTASDISTMHENEKILVMAFNIVKAHVEFVSNAQLNADAYLLSSGMSLAANSGQNAVTNLTLEATGAGAITIRVPRNASEQAFCFEYALDTTPNNWLTAGYSSLTKFVFKNQTPATKLWIRYAAISKTGMGTFSDAKQIIVL